jgi:hypothetical protein
MLRKSARGSKIVSSLKHQLTLGPMLLALVALAGSTLAATPFPSHTAGEWFWVPMEGSTCMDGKETGVYVKYGSKPGLGIYHDGGGACFNTETCAAAASSNHPGTPGTGGIFSASDARNPFKDFSWVHVPYCTGDVHLGAYSHNFDLKKRNFQGHSNLNLMAARAVATWPTPSQLVVTGESAGGFGAAASYDFLRSFWKGVDGLTGLLLDDSGPILDDTSIAPCLQEKWRKIWNINASLPDGCPCISNKGNIVDVWNFTMTKWPKDSFGLISSLHDSVISLFFSYGDLGCVNPVVPVGYTKLEKGLKRLAASGVPSYLISGSKHTHTGDKSEFYSKTVNGVALYKWVGDLLAGTNPGSVIPTKEEDASVVQTAHKPSRWDFV